MYQRKLKRVHEGAASFIIEDREKKIEHFDYKIGRLSASLIPF